MRLPWYVESCDIIEMYNKKITVYVRISKLGMFYFTVLGTLQAIWEFLIGVDD